MITAHSMFVKGDAFELEVEDIGARIVVIRHLATGRDLMAHTDAFPPRERTPEAEWHGRFAGGWNVLVPHAGEPRVVDGVAHQYHGEAARRRWDLRWEASQIAASVDLTTAPLHLERVVSVLDDAVRVTQTILNSGRRATRFGWVEHPAFDAALFAGAQLQLGDERVPVIQPGESRFGGSAGSSGLCEVVSAELGGTLGISWEGAVFPYAHVWQERGTRRDDPPWFGSVDAIAIEPATHPSGQFPGALGPVLLEPGQSLTTSVTVRVVSP